MPSARWGTTARGAARGGIAAGPFSVCDGASALCVTWDPHAPNVSSPTTAAAPFVILDLFIGE